MQLDIEAPSSDEECISLDDLSYLRKSERRGYMKKQSSRNRSTWHRRYCVLTNKLWILDVDGSPATPRAIHIDIGEQTRITSGGDLTIHIDTAKRSYVLQVESKAEHDAWLAEIEIHSNLADENSTFGMADLIMAEEGRMRSERWKCQVELILGSNKASDFGAVSNPRSSPMAAALFAAHPDSHTGILALRAIAAEGSSGNKTKISDSNNSIVHVHRSSRRNSAGFIDGSSVRHSPRAALTRSQQRLLTLRSDLSLSDTDSSIDSKCASPSAAILANLNTCALPNRSKTLTVDTSATGAIVNEDYGVYGLPAINEQERESMDLDGFNSTFNSPRAGIMNTDHHTNGARGDTRVLSLNAAAIQTPSVVTWVGRSSSVDQEAQGYYGPVHASRGGVYTMSPRPQKGYLTRYHLRTHSYSPTTESSIDTFAMSDQDIGKEDDLYGEGYNAFEFEGLDETGTSLYVYADNEDGTSRYCRENGQNTENSSTANVSATHSAQEVGALEEALFDGGFLGPTAHTGLDAFAVRTLPMSGGRQVRVQQFTCKGAYGSSCRYMHSVHQQLRISAALHKALRWTNDVHKYKEKHRHDLDVPSREQWIEAMWIFNHYLAPDLMAASDSGIDIYAPTSSTLVTACATGTTKPLRSEAWIVSLAAIVRCRDRILQNIDIWAGFASFNSPSRAREAQLSAMAAANSIMDSSDPVKSAASVDDPISAKANKSAKSLPVAINDITSASLASVAIAKSKSPSPSPSTGGGVWSWFGYREAAPVRPPAPDLSDGRAEYITMDFDACSYADNGHNDQVEGNAPNSDKTYSGVAAVSQSPRSEISAATSVSGFFPEQQGHRKRAFQVFSIQDPLTRPPANLFDELSAEVTKYFAAQRMQSTTGT